MSFFDFGPSDIIQTSIVTNPKASVMSVGGIITGSVFLERPYLNASLSKRQMQGFSEKLGGLTTQVSGLSASIRIRQTQYFANNKQLFGAIQNLYSYYSFQSPLYSLPALSSSLSVIEIPAVYYDRCIMTGSFQASDFDSSGSQRNYIDDANGGIRLTSLTGPVVGNIFYNEGLVSLFSIQDFGQNAFSYDYKINFAGSHTIPVNLYRCRAPAGQLNASTNKTFYTIPTSGPNKGTRQPLSSSLFPYITAVGLYDSDYTLVGFARLTQPILKNMSWDVAINLKMDR